MDKFVCVGKNYVDHAKELGDEVPEKPVLFLKPPSVGAFVDSWGSSADVSLPKDRGEIHHECEIILQLGKSAEVIAVSLGLDLTLRQVQGELKRKGHPWEISKVFSSSAVVGPWIPVQAFKNYLDVPFTFSLEGKVRQKGLGSQMIFSPEKCIQFARSCFPLCEGDILFTGTPAGVGPLSPEQLGEVSWGDQYRFFVRFHEKL